MVRYNSTTDMKQTKHSFDWWYVRFGGVFAVIVIKLWSKIFRKTEYKVTLVRPLSEDEPTIIAANHTTLLDPPAAFSCLTLRQLWRFSPVKFMAWHKYYNGKFKLPLYTTGSYPSHGDGLTGIRAAVHFANNSYRSFIFPEGKRIKNNQRSPAYDGVVKLLREVPEARLILVHIDWQKRHKFLSRPRLYVHMFDAPIDIDKNDSDKIMDAIYKG
jgi:1-acyl-sn-glycerol-3-phosphate acyltransferase